MTCDLLLLLSAPVSCLCFAADVVRRPRGFDSVFARQTPLEETCCHDVTARDSRYHCSVPFSCVLHGIFTFPPPPVVSVLPSDVSLFTVAYADKFTSVELISDITLSISVLSSSFSESNRERP